MFSKSVHVQRTAPMPTPSRFRVKRDVPSASGRRYVSLSPCGPFSSRWRSTSVRSSTSSQTSRLT